MKVVLLDKNDSLCLVKKLSNVDQSQILHYAITLDWYCHLELAPR